MITVQLNNSQLILLRRALQMYARQYQDLRQRERDPVHKADLQNYITAADALNTKLYDIMKEVKA